MSPDLIFFFGYVAGIVSLALLQAVINSVFKVPR